VSRSTLSMLKRRRAEFHGAGRFTRYRYPVKFHQPITSASDMHRAPVASSSHAGSFLPASLRTTTRYGQEPTFLSTGQRRRVGANSKPARVKTTAQMVDSACQCSLTLSSTSSCCQAGSGATSYVNRAVSTGHVTYQDAAVMTTCVEKTSRMTETDVRLVDLPEIDQLSLHSHSHQLHSS